MNGHPARPPVRPRSALDNFVRGAELWMHSARMTAVALGVILLFGLLVWLTGLILYLTAVQAPGKLYYLAKYGETWFFESIGMNRGSVVVVIEGKGTRDAPALVLAVLTPYRDKLERDLYNASLVGGLAALVAMLAAGLYWREFGRRKMEDDPVRGSGIVDAATGSNLLKRTGRAGAFTLAGVPLFLGA